MWLRTTGCWCWLSRRVHVVDQEVLQLEQSQPVPARIDCEHLPLHKVLIRNLPADFAIPVSPIHRYQHPTPDTPFPFEYAFHLLGEVRGKVILDLGCGDGLNTMLLAMLGARVVAVDVSEKSLEATRARVCDNKLHQNVILVHADPSAIPVQDSKVDGVLCAATLRRLDSIVVARQIRRILKPGGIAVFVEQVSGPSWWSLVKTCLVKSRRATCGGSRLTAKQVYAVSRAVGRPGRLRQFMLTRGLLHRIGVGSFSGMQRSQETDKRIFNRLEFTRSFTSPLVWEARKEC
jgi:SAM-dependent methyltransferase